MHAGSLASHDNSTLNYLGNGGSSPVSLAVGVSVGGLLLLITLTVLVLVTVVGMKRRIPTLIMSGSKGEKHPSYSPNTTRKNKSC